ncbi:MAG TPA: hypothetical protein VFU22_29645 [Roseiflexaceae bacterium]|nr:hypothetical protein [Roseiflexaceae bacterium]
MTERQGAFTISTRLLLSAEQRARLERLVLDQRIDPADLVSMIVADHCDELPSALGARPTGAVTVPIRLYLTPTAREQIDQWLLARELELADLVSQIVGDYLDVLPDAPPASEPVRDSSAELRQRRGELSRLRARRDAAGAAAPAWLASYIVELEAEVKRLEG